MTLDNADVIKKQLEQVQARILENEKLQEEYPKQKRGFLIALTTLKQLETEMIDALKDEYVKLNNEVYEIILTGKDLHGYINLEDAGEFFIQKQHMITTFGSEEALSLNAQIPGHITNGTQMALRATAGGSFKIILTRSQKVLSDVETAESPVKHAFNDIQKIIRCGSNKELLKAEESRLGPKKIKAYKDLLSTLYEKDINMEVSTRTSKKENIPILNLKTNDAKKYYNTLIEKEEPSEEDIEITGVLRAFDFTTLIHNFKIVEKSGNQEKPVRIYHSNEFDNDVLDHMNKLSKVKVQIVINQKGIGEAPSKKRFLIKFVND